MNFIRPREIMVYVIAVFTVIACAKGTTTVGGGGGGGEGGEAWGGPASASASSGSSGADGGTSCDMNAADCSACGSCSRTEGLCVMQYQDCLANTDCVDFATCISNCADGDTVCTSDCQSFYPTGFPTFDVYALCVICQDCPVTCDAASVCN